MSAASITMLVPSIVIGLLALLAAWLCGVNFCGADREARRNTWMSAAYAVVFLAIALFIRGR